MTEEQIKARIYDLIVVMEQAKAEISNLQSKLETIKEATAELQ
jgi:hypothetical protein